MRTKPWAVSDALWARVVPLVPPAPSHAKGGRTRVPDRQVFTAIVYVLRTGIQWNALPRELGARGRANNYASRADGGGQAISTNHFSSPGNRASWASTTAIASFVSVTPLR